MQVCAYMHMCLCMHVPPNICTIIRIYSLTWMFLYNSPVLQQPVILVVISAIPDDHHRMAQVRFGTVRYIQNSCRVELRWTSRKVGMLPIAVHTVINCAFIEINDVTLNCLVDNF